MVSFNNSLRYGVAPRTKDKIVPARISSLKYDLNLVERRKIVSKLVSLPGLFATTVVVPTALAVLYFGILASDVYISESKFIVRSPGKSSVSNLGVILKSAGFSNAGDELYAAGDFVTSRDALKSLNKNGEFAKAYSDPSIFVFDRFDSWGFNSEFENLFKYYTKKVSISSDASTSIATLTVRAYDPASAQAFNAKLLGIAEATVNRLNTRGRQDLVDLAKQEVSEARANARRAAAALSSYRNSAGVVDPEKQATIQLQMISKLQDELVTARTQLREVQNLAPDNPQIPVLQSRINELAQEIGSQSNQVAGGSRSLSSTAMRYQQLLLDSQFADRQLAGAMTSLEDAMSEARRKQAYVETIVEPNRPDAALEPRRWKGILSTFVLGLLIYGVLSMILASFREHLD